MEFGLYTELSQINKRDRKLANVMNYKFAEQKTQMAKDLKKKWLNSLIINEMYAISYSHGKQK